MKNIDKAKKKKIMLVFGTRPEAIKMCPLVKELRSRECFEVSVCVSGQHREMLDGVLKSFDVKPEYDLSIMKKGQSLSDVTARILTRIGGVLDEVSPDTVLVHGDTGTAFAGALACFYRGISIGHVEAGLRTYDIYSPYPEEFNRRAISLIAKYNFAPTDAARRNLLGEGIRSSSVTVTGNTAIDALKVTVRKDFSHEVLDWARDSRLVLVTAHRRESLGEPLYNMLTAIKRVLCEHRDLKAVYPVHMNPQVRKIAEEVLGGFERVRLIEPLDVMDFHNIMARSYLVLTDSGGIQEEAPSLGKPVIVMRDTTERPEGVEAGTLVLAGTEARGIYQCFSRLVEDGEAYFRMTGARNPYGDGRASERIADVLEKL